MTNYLEKPDLICLLLDDLHKKIVREDDTLISIINVNGLRFVKDHLPTSGNLIIDAPSRVGKDYMVRQINKYLTPELRYIHRARISETAFTYWHANDDNWNWNNKILHLENINSKILNCEVMQTMTSDGGNIATITDKGRAVDLIVNGKPLITCTGHNLGLNDDILNRFGVMELDKFPGQTGAIVKFRAEQRNPKNIKNFDDNLKTQYQRLSKKQVSVTIPYAKELASLLPHNIPMRTTVDRLFDYISASAAIHRYQREKDDAGYIIATYDDYFIGRITFMKTHSSYKFITLTDYDKDIIDYLKEHICADKSELIQNTMVTNFYCYEGGLDRLVANGVISCVSQYNSDKRKRLPMYFHKPVSGTALPLFPEGIDVDSQVKDYLTTMLTPKNQNTNQNTKNPFASLEPSLKKVSILVLWYIYRKCNEYSNSDRVNFHQNTKKLKTGNAKSQFADVSSYVEPKFWYYDRYFGIMVDKELTEEKEQENEYDIDI